MKRGMLLYILDILKDTDENNKLSRIEIEKRLKMYGVETLERHTVIKYLEELKEIGFDIVTEKGKQNKFYLQERMFEEWEIKLLCDLLCECSFLTQNDVDSIVDKLKQFIGTGSRNELKSSKLYYKRSNCCEIKTKYALDNIMRAINQNKKIKFSYYEYDDALRMKSKNRIYVASPYKLILKNGHYYLLLNKEGYDDVASYRVDRIGNVNIIEENRVSLENLLGKNCSKELENIVRRRLYSYDGESIKLVINVDKTVLGEIVDNFYDGTIVLGGDEKFLKIAVSTNKSNGLFYWLMQHLETVTVLEPLDVRNELLNRVRKGIENYEK